MALVQSGEDAVQKKIYLSWVTSFGTDDDPDDK
jgi:hypothetical protein